MTRAKQLLFAGISLLTVFLSIALGLFYNTQLSEKLYYFSFFDNYVFATVVLILIGVGSSFYIRCIPEIGKFFHKFQLDLTGMNCLCFLLLLVIILIKSFSLVGIVIIQGLIVGFLFPSVCYIITSALKLKYGYAWGLSAVVFYSTCIGVFFGLKIWLYSLIMFSVAFVSASITKRKIKDSKYQVALTILVGAILVLCLIVSTIIQPSLALRQEVFCASQGVPEYDAIREVLKNAEFAKYEFTTELLDQTNSYYAATYAHFVDIFGAGPTALIIGLQVIGIIIMCVIGVLTYCNRYEKTILFSCVASLVFQLFFSIGSSFLQLPLCEMGALYSTTCGLSYSLIQTVVFWCILLPKLLRKKRPMRLAFVGGPASGKTKILKILKRMVNPSYANEVSFIEESANLILSERPDAYKDTIEFQREIAELQIRNESNVNSQFTFTDRGIADAFAYTEPSKWSELPFSLQDCYERYSHALFFEKANNYFLVKNDLDTIRVEKNEADVAMITARTRDVWKKHPSIHFIEYFSTLEQKANYVAELINSICDCEIFLIDDGD